MPSWLPSHVILNLALSEAEGEAKPALSLVEGDLGPIRGFTVSGRTQMLRCAQHYIVVSCVCQERGKTRP